MLAARICAPAGRRREGEEHARSVRAQERRHARLAHIHICEEAARTDNTGRTDKIAARQILRRDEWAHFSRAPGPGCAPRQRDGDDVEEVQPHDEREHGDGDGEAAADLREGRAKGAARRRSPLPRGSGQPVGVPEERRRAPSQAVRGRGSLRSWPYALPAREATTPRAASVVARPKANARPSPATFAGCGGVGRSRDEDRVSRRRHIQRFVWFVGKVVVGGDSSRGGSPFRRQGCCCTRRCTQWSAEARSACRARGLWRALTPATGGGNART